MEKREMRRWLTALATALALTTAPPQDSAAQKVAQMEMDSVSSMAERNEIISQCARSGHWVPGEKTIIKDTETVEQEQPNIEKLGNILFWLFMIAAAGTVLLVLIRLVTKEMESPSEQTRRWTLRDELMRLWELLKSLKWSDFWPKKTSTQKPVIRQTLNPSFADAAEEVEDLDKDIEKALATGDFGLGIRLIYIKTIIELAEAKVLVLNESKVPMEYLAEVERTAPETAKKLRSLTSIFLHANYANGDVNAEMAQAAQTCKEMIGNELRTRKESGTVVGTVTLVMAAALMCSCSENETETRLYNWTPTLQMFSHSYIGSDGYEPLGCSLFSEFIGEEKGFEEMSYDELDDFECSHSSLVMLCTDEVGNKEIGADFLVNRFSQQSGTLLAAEHMTVKHTPDSTDSTDSTTKEILGIELIGGEAFQVDSLVADAEDGELEMSAISCSGKTWMYPKEMCKCRISEHGVNSLKKVMVEAEPQLGNIEEEVLATVDGEPVCIRLTSNRTHSKLIICSLPLLFTDYGLLTDKAERAPLIWAILKDIGADENAMHMNTLGRTGQNLHETPLLTGAGFPQREHEENGGDDNSLLKWLLLPLIAMLLLRQPYEKLRIVKRPDNKTIDLVKHTANTYERGDYMELRKIGQKRWVVFREQLREAIHVELPDRPTSEEASHAAQRIVASKNGNTTLTVDDVRDTLLMLSDLCTQYTQSFSQKEMRMAIDKMEQIIKQ